MILEAARLLSLITGLVLTEPQIKFKNYSDLEHGFSFDIPANWFIRADSSFENSISVCDSTSDNEIDSYKYCAEGIIFRIEHYNSNLDTTLTNSGLYEKSGDGYVTSDRVSNNVETEKIKGVNWTGIYHNNICGVTCYDEETQESNFHAAGGQCEVMYFSNGERTIRISTNGRSLDELILKQILTSFKFTD
jgi:hypothetical protein